MIIETQVTPDPNVLNFFPQIRLLKSGHAEFIDTKSLRKSPLAEKIFDIGGIVSIFITEEMLSITKKSDAVWEELKPQILAEIMDYAATGEDVVVDSAGAEEALNDVVDRIKGLLNARIRPAVKQDGGDIVFHRFEDGVVFVEMKGNCAGCPYAMVTLKEGVEKILKTYIPEVKAVKSVTPLKEK